jgi:hypothetical protein
MNGSGPALDVTSPGPNLWVNCGSTCGERRRIWGRTRKSGDCLGIAKNPLDVGFRTAQDAPRPPQRHGQRRRSRTSVQSQIRRTSRCGGPVGMPTETIEVGRPPRSDPGQSGACSAMVGSSDGTSRVAGNGPARPVVRLAPSSGPASSGLTLGAFLIPALSVLGPPSQGGDHGAARPPAPRPLPLLRGYVRRFRRAAIYVGSGSPKWSARPMWPGTSAVHAGPMLLNDEFTRTWVTEHQDDLRREASRLRLARLAGRHRQRRRLRPFARSTSGGL